MNDTLAALDPHIRLFGNVDDAMFQSFLEQMNRSRKEVPSYQPLLVELTTTGGDAETARRIASDIRLLRELESRTIRFLGKGFVYSAGITIMAAFPREDRWLTRGTELLIHERRLERTVQLSGALRTNMAKLRDLMAELESGRRLEMAGFRELAAGTPMTADGILEKVLHADWYLSADQAFEAGLVRGVV